MSNTPTQPLISIITPVYNGRATLDRAIGSVLHQTFADWELLLIDDCSTDGSTALLENYAKQDTRFRIFRTPERVGKSAARNLGLQNAQGECICYLDPEDEYYPDYMAVVAQACKQADVLVFHHDLRFEDAPPDMPLETWQPENASNRMFCDSIAAPLAVAHRRALVERVGGFDERLWTNEDTELWRRFARIGAEFRFLAHKSGLLHVQAERVQPPTAKQRAAIEANFHADKPPFGDRPHSRPVKKIAFISPHCVIDYTNGAAVATFAGTKALAAQGFECQAFCATRLDAPEEVVIAEVFARQGLNYDIRNAQIGPYQGRMLFALAENLPVTLIETASTRGGWRDDEEIATFLTACELFLNKFQPDVVWTYGGDPVSLAVQQMVKQRDITLLFALHNFAYNAVDAFRLADYVTVPANYSKQYYWDRLGLASQILPNIVNWDAAYVPERTPRYVTFINPQTLKGIHIFARMAHELARRRPDISLLVTQGRSADNALSMPELDLESLARARLLADGTEEPIGNGEPGRNLVLLPYLPDPQDFYPRVFSQTKILLMPSLWEESFGLVAAEAMLNGIPVLASNRGALPDTVGQGGFIFDIPACYTPDTRIVASAEEVEPWVQTIIRLCDDADYYQRTSESARNEAQRWHPDRLLPFYHDFFSNLHPQPYPPLIPK